MEKTKKGWAQWVIGLTLATVMLAVIVLYGDLRYASNDDGLMLRPLMGFEAKKLP